MPVTPRSPRTIRPKLRFLIFYASLLTGLCCPVLGQSKSGVDVLIRQGKLPAAEQQLRLALKKNPRDARALNLLGVVRQKQGRFLEAEAQFQKAIEADPKFMDAYSNFGSLCAEEGRIDDAIIVFERALSLQPAGTKAKVALAALYQRKGEYEKSLKTIEQIPMKSRTDNLLPVLAANYIGLNRSAEVKVAVGEVLEKSAVNPELAPQLAMFFLRKGSAGDALELLRIAGTRQKQTSTFLGVLAKAKLLGGKPDEAKAAAKKALALNPKNADALFVQARLAGSAGDWKTAVDRLKKAVVSAPPTSENLQSLVYAAMQIDDLQTAHDAAQDFRSLWPDSLDSGLVLSAVLVRGSHWGEAKPLLDAILAQNPEDKRALLASGVVEYNLGNMDEAKKKLIASLGQDAGDAEAHYVLGLIEKQLGDIPAATIQMEAAVRLNPGKAEALSSLGQFYLQQNELPKARAMLEQAVQKLPDDSQNRYQLAQVYRKLGMTEQAKEQMVIFQKLSARNVTQPVGETTSSPK